MSSFYKADQTVKALIKNAISCASNGKFTDSFEFLRRSIDCSDKSDYQMNIIDNACNQIKKMGGL